MDRNGARPLRLLYIARTFPPVVGGMQMLALRLSEHMRQHADVTLLANRLGKGALPAFLPYAIVAGSHLARRNHVDAIHLADALLAPVGVALKKLTHLPVTATVCGLDVTYANRLYQDVVPRALDRLDMAIAISEAARREVTARCEKVPTTVIPLGTLPAQDSEQTGIRELKALAGVNGSSRLVLSVGRLVERKGVAWFVEHVLPALPEDTTYVVVGEGQEAAAIRQAAERSGVAGRVRLLGAVSDDLLQAAYRAADVFVMPNLPVPGDIEGFGLVALEAAASGLPVVASDLEGITEAIQHERNGLLVRPMSAGGYTSAVRDMLALPAEERRDLGAAFRDYTLAKFSWDAVARRYVDTIRNVAHAR
jgi:glycosyltransferase involved in cell wall biosynthesis